MSGEVEGDPGTAYMAVSRTLERAVAPKFAPIDYGGGLERWTFIGIVRDDEAMEEIFRVNKKRKEFESRVQIPFREFARADEIARRKLLVEAMLRALDRLPSLLPEADATRLREDLSAFVSG